jgi:hypothetical protein
LHTSASAVVEAGSSVNLEALFIKRQLVHMHHPNTLLLMAERVRRGADI